MGKASEMLLAKMGGPPDPRTKLGKKIAQGGVCLSPEFIRIRDLPRRPVDDERYDLSEFFVINPDKCGVESCMLCLKTPVRVLPKQNQMLHEAYEQNGLITSAGVGSGKTFPSLAFHEIFESVRSVLFVKARCREKLFNDDLPAYRRHFRIPPVFYAPRRREPGRRLQPGIYVVTYSELSLASREWILDYIAPDLLVWDEGHVFKSGRRGSARTKRFFRFQDNHPEVRNCGMSGSFLRRSMRDVAPLAELCLKKDSPYPRGPALFEFSRAIDPDVEQPLHPGKLMDLTTFYEDEHGNVVQETARDGLRRRIAETPGFVATPYSSAPEVSLEIHARQVKLSPEVISALKQLENTWSWDGTEYGDALSMTRIRRQLCCGFFYKWKWENGEPTEEDLDWLDARNAWNKEVREYLKYHSVPGRDSPLQLFNAAARGEWKSDTFLRWCAVKDRKEPETETVWIDKQPYMDDARAWIASIGKNERGNKGDRGIIFYEHRALQALYAEMGLPTYGAGKEAATLLDKELASPRHQVICCSRLSHSTGVNMQRYNHLYAVNPPASGVEWQQMVGRQVRQGQFSDTVYVDVPQHTESLQGAWEQAQTDAKFQQELGGEPQLILIADKFGFT